MRRIILIGLLGATACLDAPNNSPVASLQVTTNASGLGVFVGDQVQVSAQALDVSGDVLPEAFTYSSSNLSVATVTTAGLITAIGPGSVTIGVATLGQSTSLTLTVDGNITGSVQVSPLNPTVPIHTSLTLTATVMTTLNNPARAKTVTWTTPDSTKVSVDHTGIVSGVAATATGESICATASDATTIKGCTTVFVSP